MGHVSYIYNYHNTYDNLFFNIYSHDNFYEVVSYSPERIQ